MKKFSKILLIAGASLLILGGIVLAVYTATKKETPTFNELVIEDYHSVADTLSEGTSFFFYEVEVILNGEVDSLPVEDIKVVDYKCILQTEKNTHFIHRDIESGLRGVETVYGDTWGGCFPIDSPEFTISFEQAVDSILASPIRTPHTRYMTLRRPMNMRYPNPIYIFGKASSAGVCVDAETGKVMIFE